MKTWMRMAAASAGAAMAILFTGCGGSATATLQFTNATPGSLTRSSGLETLIGAVAPLATYTPTTFRMKLIAAYLAEDIDPTTQNNVGMTSMFYLNPTCGDDIMHCDISAGTAEDGAAMSRVITDYFDFSGSSAAVNAALNAQGREIETGTYKYVRVEFCKYNSGNSNNIQWGYSPGSVSKEFQRNMCTVNSAVISPPLEVNGDDSVTVSLAYDLTGKISDSSSGSYDDSSGGYYFTMPTFTPSASK